MVKLFRVIGCLLFICMSVTIQAQPTATEQMDIMRSNGKIYVVVAVVITILLGMFVYLFSLDRKISRVEKNKTSGTSL